ncbi:hypothetical protein Patl1_33127 [Pistacia atlantica]|uniref:Uncharacterized protein n=1 Tax=Pistacia atlantica TaxID=434234 RepID=A0ACC1AQ92_9ROSI|nr:hypothetical protein Patl1_33127 [Pistacia atlantica]
MKTKTTPSLSNSSRGGEAPQASWAKDSEVGSGSSLNISGGLVVDGKLWCVPFGGVHSVALTSLGNFSLGHLIINGSIIKICRGFGGFGAVGHSVYHRELFPRLVEGSWNGKIRHIATSGTHTAAITESGELYTWVDMKEMEDWALVLVEALI